MQKLLNEWRRYLKEAHEVDSEDTRAFDFEQHLRDYAAKYRRVESWEGNDNPWHEDEEGIEDVFTIAKIGPGEDNKRQYITLYLSAGEMWVAHDGGNDPAPVTAQEADDLIEKVFYPEHSEEKYLDSLER